MPPGILQRPWSVARDLWQQAQAGDSAFAVQWVRDHFTAPEREIMARADEREAGDGGEAAAG